MRNSQRPPIIWIKPSPGRVEHALIRKRKLERSKKSSLDDEWDFWGGTVMILDLYSIFRVLLRFFWIFSMIIGYNLVVLCCHMTPVSEAGMSASEPGHTPDMWQGVRGADLWGCRQWPLRLTPAQRLLRTSVNGGFLDYDIVAYSELRTTDVLRLYDVDDWWLGSPDFRGNCQWRSRWISMTSVLTQNLLSRRFLTFMMSRTIAQPPISEVAWIMMT